MKTFDEIEAEAQKHKKAKKPKMKVSGKSVFVMARAGAKKGRK